MSCQRIRRLLAPHRLGLLLLFFLAAPAFGQGRGEDWRPVEGLENWDAGIDLAPFAPGTYNLVIRAKDRAGNLQIAGPFNLVVDPASDLPRVTIINPTPLLRVGGDLNIVGTCLDDDGVAKVEVALDEGDFREAEGGAFWSFPLPTVDLPEGRRLLSVRATDVNGLVGPVTTVSFNLDLTRPVAEVDAPVVGSLVAGLIRLEGRVHDANGVASLALSLDGGKGFQKVELRGKALAEDYGFSIAVDTRKLDDGAKIFWLRSVDGVGSESTSSFLLFIDNTKPELTVVRPAAGASVSGRFTVVGTVGDIVGVSRLAWEFGGEKGEFELTKGDPSFAREFDTLAIKGDKAEVTLVATDAIGNQTKLVISPRVDREADKPLLLISGPAPGSKLRVGDLVWGAIRDVDEVTGLRWSLDGSAPATVEASDLFSLPIPDAASGKHLLSLAAVDEAGILGHVVSLPFVLDRGPPLVSISRIATDKASRPWSQGSEVRVDAGEFLEGRVVSPNPPARAEYAVAASAPKKLELAVDSPGAWKWRIPLDRSLPYGFADIAIRVVDSMDNLAETSALLSVLDYGVPREDTGFRFVDARIDAGGRVRFEGSGSERKALVGTFYREELASVLLDPPTDLVRVDLDGELVSILPLRDGVSLPTTVKGTTGRGHVFSAGPFVFDSDRSSPTLDLDSPAEGLWFREGFTLSGKAADAGGLVSLSFRLLPSGDALEIPASADGSFALSLGPADLPSGATRAVSIVVEARDASGNLARAFRDFGFDAEAPTVSFLSPAPGSTVSGPEDLVALLDDASGIASVEYAEDGKAFAALPWKQGWFAQRVDLLAHPEAAWRVVDLAGNVWTGRPSVELSPPVAAPALSDTVSVEPGADEALVELAGGGTQRPISLRLPALSSSSFGELPAAAFPLPERFGTRLAVSAALSLKGSASLAALGGQLKAVSLSHDGGSTWLPLASASDPKKAKESLAFTLAADPAKLGAGPGLWLLRLEDSSSATWYAPLYVQVDAKGPEIQVVSPPPGTALSRTAPLVLRVTDDLGLASLDLGVAGGGGPGAGVAAEGGSWFSLPLDPGAVKGGILSFSVSARDRVGNATVLPLKYSFDAAAAAPRIALSSPADPAGVLAAGDLVAGSFSGAAGSLSLAASVDGGEGQDFSGGSFSLALPQLAAGKHRLLLSLSDGAGRLVEQRLDFVSKGPAPSLGDFEAGDKAGRVALRPGMGLESRAGLALNGTLSAPNGLASLQASFNGGSPQKVEAGKPASAGAPLPFSLTLPAGLPFDRILVSLVARDSAGLVGEERLEFHLLLPSPAGSDNADGIRFPASSAGAASGAAAGGTASEARILLAPGDEVVGAFRGRPLASIALEPPIAGVEATFEASTLRLRATEEGIASGRSLVAVTVDGDRFVWGPVTFSVDAAPPLLSLDQPESMVWLRLGARLAGSAADANGIASLLASIDGGPPLDLFSLEAGDPSSPPQAGAGAAKELAFDRLLPFGEAPEGALRIDLVATDLAGRSSTLARLIDKDSIPPLVGQVFPAPGGSINGRTTVILEVTDAGRLAAASWKASNEADAEDLALAPILTHQLDFARLALPLPEGFGFTVADRAGNSTLFAPDLLVDEEKDKPVVEILSPLEDEVFRRDFSISGFAHDDDGVASLSYRVDGGEWLPLPLKDSSFALPVRLAETPDNGHLVEIAAEDLYGVRGETARRSYRISRYEPVAKMDLPAISRPVRGLVDLAGSASDANGIAEVLVSVDNRTTFRAPAGTAAWTIPLDTRLLADGIHPVSVKPVDGYGTEGFYASMVGVDNTLPIVSMDLPADGARVARELLVSGRASDNEGLDTIRVEIAPIGSKDPAVLVVDTGTASVVRRSVDISALPPGAYSAKIIARDRAGNEALASRDFTVAGRLPEDSVSILFPSDGQRVKGHYKVQGLALVTGLAGEVRIFADNAEIGSASPDANGWFSLDLPPDLVVGGSHLISASAVADDGRSIESRPVRFEWMPEGPWVSVDGLKTGDYLPERPWLQGSSGWIASTDGGQDEATPPSPDERKKREAAQRPLRVEVSLDNGLHFAVAEGASVWRYRLETLDMPEGSVHLLVRATFGDGSTAVRRSWFFLDKTPPGVTVLEPAEAGHYNGTLAVSGHAHDSSGLVSVEVALRKGDKRGYEVPTFIQGLYLDAQLLGATTWQAGAGLTFLNDNVKLQALYGQAPGDDANPQSFYGDVFGAKLIANIAYLPFSAIFGPDWSFLSASFGLGANFTYFTKTQSGQGLIVGAVFGQLEFPKLTFRDLSVFKKFSLYTEFQVWVLSSVVSGGFIPRLSFGARVGVF